MDEKPDKRNGWPMTSWRLSESFPYLTPQDHVFTSRFHYKIKRKGGEFVQGELLPGDGHNGKVYMSSPPGYDEDPL